MTVKRFLTIAAVMAVFLLVVGIGVRSYQWNVSALFHMDAAFGERHAVPEGIVLYEDAGYDGMLYEQVARDLPALFSGGHTSFDSPYRFQRVLLPALAYIVTLGQEPAFPWAFLLINMAAVVATLGFMMAQIGNKPLHLLTTVFNPAMLVGVLYMLTEPVSSAFIALFLFLWNRSGRTITPLGIAALTLSLFARETTIFLIALLIAWSLWWRRWKEAVVLLVPIILLAAWQYFLVLRFGAVGFQANSNVMSIPFEGPVQVVRWLMETWHPYRLSTFGLMAFVLPLFVVVAREWAGKRTRIDVLAFLLGGLAVTMLSMDAHMWGAITSIGRVVTPIYPVYALYAAERDTWVERTLSVILIVISIIAAVGIAMATHPYHIS